MSELKAETIVSQGTTITLQMYPKAEADKVLPTLPDGWWRAKLPWMLHQ